MVMSHTDKRILKLSAKGLSEESIARKIGRPGDVERVRKALNRHTDERVESTDLDAQDAQDAHLLT